MIIHLRKEDKHFLLELTRALTVALSMSSPKVDTYKAGIEVNKILKRAEELADIAPKPDLGEKVLMYEDS